MNLVSVAGIGTHNLSSLNNYAWSTAPIKTVTVIAMKKSSKRASAC